MGNPPACGRDRTCRVRYDAPTIEIAMPPAARRSLLLTGIILLITAGCAPSRCDHRTPPAPVERATRPTAASPDQALPPPIVGEPTIRVRILRHADRTTIEGPVQVILQAGPENSMLGRTPLDLDYADGRWRNHGHPLLRSPRTRLILKPQSNATLQVDNQPYPGWIELRAVAPGAFDVINHVKLETYLPGVLELELYDRWHMSAYQAQAIAARSYALACMEATRHRAYDVEDTQASQAYAGLTANAKARQAVLDTHGLVLSHKDRILKAYYSSTCGGAGLSPAEAFGVKGQDPLTPTHTCTACRGTRHERWPTLARPRATLTRRFAAYGRSHKLPLKDLTRIKGLAVAERNKFNRPTQFVIIDQAGKRHLLRAESFRHACNASDPAVGLPPPPRGKSLSSSFCNVELNGDRILFTHGRGFGHGVGLCQYGANNMARRGVDPLDILRFYYPGARIERAY